MLRRDAFNAATVRARPVDPGSARVRAERGERAVAYWLLFCCGMIFVMVVLGGVTRLTLSGLSITEWRPVTGALPPLSHAAWLAEFEK
jgi:heme a synthase